MTSSSTEDLIERLLSGKVVVAQAEAASCLKEQAEEIGRLRTALINLLDAYSIDRHQNSIAETNAARVAAEDAARAALKGET